MNGTSDDKRSGDDMKDNSDLPLPMFLAGMGAGIALALLLAPLSGAATRRLILRKAKQAGDRANGEAENAQEFVRSRAAEVRERVKDAVDGIAL
jgi:gas vesicle protein